MRQGDTLIKEKEEVGDKMKIAVTEYVSKEEQAELDIILKDVLSKPIEIDEEETVTIEV